MNMLRHLVAFLVVVALTGLLALTAHAANKTAPAATATPYISVPALPSQPAVPSTAPAEAAPATSTTADYVLGAGDEIRMTVYGEDDLSGQYLIGSTGIVALPLIGNMQAAGQTIHQFEEAVHDKFSQGYLKDPHVGVQVVNYRPFFILGEVTRPGSYPFVNGMRVLTAIAIGGGYTYRADKGDIRIVHASDPDKAEQDAKETDVVMPGDIIRVPERFF